MAVATVRDGQGAERDVTITDPIAVAVSEGAGGALSNGVATCNRLDIAPGAFTYKTGRNAVLHQAYTEPDGSPCCWAPTEVLAATVVVKAEVDDGQGGTILVTKEATTIVESIPRPADPCEVRAMQSGTPELASYDAYNLIEVGDVYLTDVCGNIVHGVGLSDSEHHDQPGDEFRITSPLDPPGEGVWATALSGNNQWSWSVRLHGDVGTPDQIPDGSYTIDFEVASQSLECSEDGVISGAYTVNTTMGAPQVVLWWDWIWDAENSPRGPNPEDALISPGSAVRDRSGAVAMWRVPAFNDATVDHFFEGPYTDVPVKLYVAWHGTIPFDEDGNLGTTYLQPVEGVELCTGTIEKLTDAGGSLDYNSPVRVTCETTWATVATVSASSDPTQTGHTPDTWVPVGLGVGMTKGPEQPGNYVLVAEPVDEDFRRGDAWKVMSSLVADGFVGFEVGGGVFLDEDWRPLPDPPEVMKDTTLINLIFSHRATADSVPITVASIQDEVEVDSIVLDATRIGKSSFGVPVFHAVFVGDPAGIVDPPPAGAYPFLIVPPLASTLQAGVDPPSPPKSKEDLSKQLEVNVMATAPVEGVLTVDFGSLDYAQAQGDFEPIRVLLSSCPNENPGCLGVTVPFLGQRTNVEGHPFPEIEITLTPKIRSGVEINVDPNDVYLVLEVIDPDDVSAYDDPLPTDNFELLDPGNQGPLIPQVVSQQLPSGSWTTLAEMPRDHRHFFLLDVSSTLTSEIGLRIGNLSPHPGDNYRLAATFRMKTTVNSWIPPSVLPSISRDFEMWERLFVEDDPSYADGMLLAASVPEGASSVIVAAIDYEVAAVVEADLGCNIPDDSGGCCEQVGDPCQRPSITLVINDGTPLVSAFLRTVECENLGDPDRSAHLCTLALVDASDDDFSMPLPFDTGQFVTGGVTHSGDILDIPEVAKNLIKENMDLMFHEVYFFSEISPEATTPIPKLPKYWGDDEQPYGWLWHLDLWRQYFDNNDPNNSSPSGEEVDIDNVIHIVTANDQTAGSGFLSGFSGLSTAVENISTIYFEHFFWNVSHPAYWRNSVWVHELFHQFAINHCGNLDHCSGTSSTVAQHPYQCLMNTDGYHGSYIGVGCAIPGVPPVGRIVCPDGSGNPQHVRYNNNLNASP